MLRPSKILEIKASQILDSRKKKTLQLDLVTDFGLFSSSVPSGTSKGKYEALETKPEKAIFYLNKIVKPFFIGRSVNDKELIKIFSDKNLGANLSLALSIALFRARAKFNKIPLWKYISLFAKIKPKIPKPSVLIVEGGLHGNIELDFQEFMVIPELNSFSQQFYLAREIYVKAGKVFKSLFGRKGIITGLEGAFTPPISDPKDILNLLKIIIGNYNVKIGLDCAVSHLKKEEYDDYFYETLIKNYPILFLEDPFGQDDWRNWINLNSKLRKEKSKVLIVGDDLTTTNPQRIFMARKKKACNAVIIKPNQIGTVEKAIEAVKLAKSYGWKIIVSHRSGETKDDFIADFSVGVGADYIKTGAPKQVERMVKYNRLLEIEKEWQN